MTKLLMIPAAGVLLIGLAACNPYNPADRAVGAGLGAATGVLTTPAPPPPPPYYR